MILRLCAATGAALWCGRAAAADILTTRTDSVANIAVAGANGVGAAATSTQEAFVFSPASAASVDWASAEGETIPAPNASARRAVGETENFVIWSSGKATLTATADAAGLGHVFKPAVGSTPTTLSAVAGFATVFGSLSSTPPDIVFANAPTAALNGPTAILTATLTSTTVGANSRPQLRVTGTILTASGMRAISRTTTHGRIFFATSLPAPATWTLRTLNATIPTARVASTPSPLTGFGIGAIYEARYK